MIVSAKVIYIFQLFITLLLVTNILIAFRMAIVLATGKDIEYGQVPMSLTIA